SWIAASCESAFWRARPSRGTSFEPPHMSPSERKWSKRAARGPDQGVGPSPSSSVVTPSRQMTAVRQTVGRSLTIGQ
ncbi:MAG: hypothetical protein ACREJ3_11860, partial [Polyangiaceae bacterium]